MGLQRAWAAGFAACFLTAGCAASPPAGSPTGPSGPVTVTAFVTPTTAPPTTEPSIPAVAQDDWSQVLADVRESVVRLSTTPCSGEPSMGSGFIVDDHLIITAAHVVVGARTVSVQTSAGRIVTAEPVDLEMDADAALLRTAQSLGAKAMTMSDQEPSHGSALAALGFPLGANDLRIAQGIVSGLGSSIEYADQSVDNVFTTDAATNGGNSGGPVINHSGEVIGLVSGGRTWDSADVDSRRPVEGINYIVPSTELVTRLEQWRDQPTSPPEVCGRDVERPVEGDYILDVSVVSTHEDAGDIAQTLFSHGDGINTGSYSSAWTLFTPGMQDQVGGLDTWQSGLSSSYWKAVEVSSVDRTGDTAIAQTVLRTEQDADDGPHGQTCSVWLINYRMKLVEGQWLIDKAKARTDPSAC